VSWLPCTYTSHHIALSACADTRALTIPLVIHVLVRPILAQQQTASVEVAVMGPCRRLPHVKHTSWVSFEARERRDV
jgi:hypothetical protein